MKREEKNMMSRKKIMDSALKEFADKGYDKSSVNIICNEGGISKGILYHYFKDKNELYLTCVKEAFDQLTSYLKEHQPVNTGDTEQFLNLYFEARFDFFKHNPLYQRIFCTAVVMPPEHLKEDIDKIKSEFDQLNHQILNSVLSSVELRCDVTYHEVVDTFSQYQNFINAKYQSADTKEIDAAAREKACRKTLSILLYGILKRN